MVAAIPQVMRAARIVRVVVVDAEPSFARTLTTESRDVEILRVPLELNALPRLVEEAPDAIIIGRSIPFAQVVSLCRAVRGHPQLMHTPIAIFSYRHGGAEEVQALEAGADDYVGTSITPTAVLARIRSLVRRNARPSASFQSTGRSSSSSPALPPELDDAIQIGRIAVAPDSYCLFLDGKRINLTAGEFRLLWQLVVHAGKTLAPAQLGGAFGSGREAPTEQSIRSRIHALRRKLGSASGQIQTVKNAGYRIVP